MQAACRGSICFCVRLCSVVNEAKALITDSRAMSMPSTEARHAETWRPWSASVVGFGPTNKRSKAWENADSAGPHATSNILGAASAAAFARSALLLKWVTAMPSGENAGRVAPFCWRSSDTDARTMSSRSRWKASALRRDGFGPRPNCWKTVALWTWRSASASLAFLSSSSVMGADLMRSKIASRNSGSRSLSFAMPRLFFRKPSLVMRFSSLMAGLCRSVCSMITENASTKATSADGKTVLLKAQYRSANFSIMRSIFCASPGNRKPARKWRIAMSNSMPVKSSWSTYSCSTLTQKPFWYSFSLPRYSPICVLLSLFAFVRRNRATASGVFSRWPLFIKKARPCWGLMLNWTVASRKSSWSRCLRSYDSTLVNAFRLSGGVSCAARSSSWSCP
mmetsp:Transcript_8611/g.26413  ORF Transcript_8611/g.26413 Transcript_8611/m.26413 type:complete len:394 (+) Transcript_8611:4289-5470(+)